MGRSARRPARQIETLLLLLCAGIVCCNLADSDRDGYDAESGDCDDEDASSYPGADEVCDTLDNDCDGSVDEGIEAGPYYRDADGDGIGGEAFNSEACAPLAGYVETGGDCNDDDPTVYPGADEVCDGDPRAISTQPSQGVDNDCDPYTLEQRPFYPDLDRDGFGAEDASPIYACEVPFGYAPGQSDCNDTSAVMYPGAEDEEGDGIDRDCGGVDGSQPSVGLSASAFSSIQEALDGAPEGVTVWVGPGTWFEHDITFAGRALVLAGASGPEFTVIDAGGAGRVMIFASREGSGTQVRGLTLRGGFADRGGGIKMNESSPTLTDVIIRDNRTDQYGAGVSLTASRAVFERCLIVRNTNESEYGYGGGVSLSRSSPRFENCVIAGNRVVFGVGGGLYISDSEPRLTYCQIKDNSAEKGGGVRLDASSPTISSSTIEDNVAVEGGGLSISFSGGAVRNTTIRGNEATLGGGFYVKGSDLEITNVLVTENYAEQGGGGYVGFSNVWIRFTVVAGNSIEALGGGAGLFLSGGTNTPRLENSIFAYNYGFDLYNDPENPVVPELVDNAFYNSEYPGSHNLAGLPPGNLMQEPELLGYVDGLPANYHLALTSPLVDAGSDTSPDRDGSVADIGLYGGSYGDEWDRDADGKNDYFWPGELEEPPSGFSAASFDCDDEDPEIQACEAVLASSSWGVGP